LLFFESITWPRLQLKTLTKFRTIMFSLSKHSTWIYTSRLVVHPTLPNKQINQLISAQNPNAKNQTKWTDSAFYVVKNSTSLWTNKSTSNLFQWLTCVEEREVSKQSSYVDVYGIKGFKMRQVLFPPLLCYFQIDDKFQGSFTHEISHCISTRRPKPETSQFFHDLS